MGGVHVFCSTVAVVGLSGVLVVVGWLPPSLSVVVVTTKEGIEIRLRVPPFTGVCLAGLCRLCWDGPPNEG